MKQRVIKLLSRYPIYLVLLLLYLIAFIFSGFFIHIFINHWTLIAGFTSYNLAWLIYLLIRRHNKLVYVGLLLASVATPLLFWGITVLFSHTYDVSYDGEQYQQTAIIALSDRWNPVYQAELPVHGEGQFSKSLVLGSPKIIWSIDASIYKLSGNINAATAINLIIMLLALVLCYMALRSLGLEVAPAVLLSLLAVVSQLLIEQVFSFRQDAASYEFLIIGVSSLIISIKQRQKLPYFLCIATTLIFLAGSKFTNLFVFVPFVILILYIAITYNWYRLRSLWVSGGILVLIGCITLTTPYITNLLRYHSLDYPYNQKSMVQFAKITDLPGNIRNDNRFELFFYGIFSWADVGNPQLASGNAHLKVPLALSSNELLSDGYPFAKLVGGYGSLFSGVMILAAVSYLYLVCKRKTGEEKLSFKWLSLVLGLIVLASLLSPVPNYARFNGQLVLFPVAVATVLIMRQQHKKRMVEKLMYMSLIALLSLNLLLTLSYASAFDSLAFKSLNAQLTSFRDSRYTYAVYASTFYSNYTMLRQADVSIRIASKPLQCKNMILLDYSNNSTELCKLQSYTLRKSLNHIELKVPR